MKPKHKKIAITLFSIVFGTILFYPLNAKIYEAFATEIGNILTVFLIIIFWIALVAIIKLFKNVLQILESKEEKF